MTILRGVSIQEIFTPSNIALSDDGNILVSASQDGCVRVWIVNERLVLQDEMDKTWNQLMRIEKWRIGVDEKLEEQEYDDVNETELRKNVGVFKHHHVRRRT